MFTVVLFRERDTLQYVCVVKEAKRAGRKANCDCVVGARIIYICLCEYICDCVEDKKKQVEGKWMQKLHGGTNHDGGGGGGGGSSSGSIT